MRRISNWLKRRFKELDLLEAYFPLLFTRWQAAIWGGSVLAVAFGWRFITSDWPHYVKLSTCVVALFFAGYYVWRADHIRLQQKVFLTRVRDQKWNVGGRDGVGYYFEIVNKSEALTIHGIHVQLEKMIPEVENLDWLPVPLQQKHDNPPAGTAHKRDFNLNPSEPKHIDLVSAFYGDRLFTIHHIAGAGVNQSVQILGEEHYRLRVMVTAQDMPALYAWFDVWMNKGGILQCDLEKA